jgi:hypothetical protein
MKIFNLGELAFYDRCEVIEGDEVEFSQPSKLIEIPKNGQLISGRFRGGLVSFVGKD